MFPRLSELSAAMKTQQIVEGRRGGEMHSLIEKWMDQNKAYSFEGPRGERNFTKLVGVLGYRDLSSFLEDNSGCFEAMVQWLGTQNNSEWVEKMSEDLMPDDLDDETNEGLNEGTDAGADQSVAFGTALGKALATIKSEYNSVSAVQVRTGDDTEIVVMMYAGSNVPMARELRKELSAAGIKPTYQFHKENGPQDHAYHFEFKDSLALDKAAVIKAAKKVYAGYYK